MFDAVPVVPLPTLTRAIELIGRYSRLRQVYKRTIVLLFERERDVTVVFIRPRLDTPAHADALVGFELGELALDVGVEESEALAFFRLELLHVAVRERQDTLKEQDETTQSISGRTCDVYTHTQVVCCEEPVCW